MITSHHTIANTLLVYQQRVRNSVITSPLTTPNALCCYTNKGLVVV